jgi:hypothetical protein
MRDLASIDSQQEPSTLKCNLKFLKKLGLVFICRSRIENASSVDLFDYADPIGLTAHGVGLRLRYAAEYSANPICLGARLQRSARSIGNHNYRKHFFDNDRQGL